MASGFFLILDDIGALMDDIAVTTKVAAHKTAAILGDDLAVNAEQATGFLSSRELPVLWAITKGSFVNKLILLPVVFLLNYFLPVAIKVLLVLGGIYLAFEGVEKIVEFIFHRKKKPSDEEEEEDKAIPETEISEKEKIRGAIKTDFILSIEIVIIALGATIERKHPLSTQIIVVTLVSFLATVGVYGIVALIVRMDDAGFFLIKKSHQKGLLYFVGRFLIKLLPIIIKILAVVGTIALVLVGGGIFIHYIDFVHHLVPKNLPVIVGEAAFGLTVGLLALGAVKAFQQIRLLIRRI